MCGITGWIDWRENISNREPTLHHMALQLSKRGPDALNTFISTHVGFGHTRLVVVDPDGGCQPMRRTFQEHEYTIVYNGELYNTEDLRKELMLKGHTFQSHSDTEVLVTSYIEWGPSCVEKLNGIFAFAIWDEKEQRVYLARDRLGVKPLFFARQESRLLFGSEIKALLAHPAISPNIDREGIAEVLGLGPSRTPGHGVFKGIDELRPAHYMIFDRQGLQIKRYWQVKSHPHTDSLEDTTERVRALLQDAIERQLVADVPVCTFLSGGVDSSAITAFAAHSFQKERKGVLHTYSIDYADNDRFFTANDYQPDSDEPFIQKMSSYIGNQHSTKLIHMNQLIEYLKNAVRARDLPGMADIDSSLLWFCEQVRAEATVALSGECADEIFGGYPWFHDEELMAREGFPWMHALEERQRLLKHDWHKRLDLKEYAKSQYNKSLAEVPRLEGETPQEARRRELFYLNVIWFMTTLLDRKDRMSMAASLEVRVPFADHRLIEYVWNIPWEMKMVDQKEKGILRRALRGVLPDEVLYRKKSPYPKTHHPEYTAAVRAWLEKIIDDKDCRILEIMDRQAIEDLIQSHGTKFKRPWFGQLMTGPQVMANICQIDTWLRAYDINIDTA
ncbi:asparagine synthase (glutamine-hydrolyzing) [Caldalkalibacillus salinus]|uniref:asparagine synthase (glutamine-hydrolyzing) n=1 Tax=Caldalkalibacillus salinus TaxID=2803787 RepID=UPI00192253B8